MKKKNQKKHQKGEGKITKNYFEKSVKLKWNPKLMLNKITEKNHGKLNKRNKEKFDEKDLQKDFQNWKKSEAKS